MYQYIYIYIYILADYLLFRQDVGIGCMTPFDQLEDTTKGTPEAHQYTEISSLALLFSQQS